MDSHTVTFSPAQTSVMVSIGVVDDDVLESVEQFRVGLVATEGQERVDVGDPADIFISNDDCEISNMSHVTCLTGILIFPACLPASFLCVCVSVCLCLPLCLPLCQSVCLTISL